VVTQDLRGAKLSHKSWIFICGPPFYFIPHDQTSPVLKRKNRQVKFRLRGALSRSKRLSPSRRVNWARWIGHKDALYSPVPCGVRKKIFNEMKPTVFVRNFAVSALVIAGLGLTGCQQSPPPAAVTTPPQQSPPPTTSTDSTTTTKSTEVKPADPADPDAPPAVKTTTTESTTVKKKQ
jgi:hypothetical protein